MSFHFYLYRAPAGSGPMTRWERMLAEPLGTVGEVKEQLAALFPQVNWTRHQSPLDATSDERETWFGMGPHGAALPYIDILLNEDASGQVHFVVLNKAPPSVMRQIVSALSLSDVSAPESGDLVDLDGYTDEDRYFAKKPWP